MYVEDLNSKHHIEINTKITQIEELETKFAKDKNVMQVSFRDL